TNKHADSKRIVSPQVFPDIGNPVSARLNFHRVFQIKDGIEFPVYRDVKEIGIKRIEQMIDYPIVENVIAHREKKRLRDAIGRCEQRNAILFLPIAILNERRDSAVGYQ